MYLLLVSKTKFMKSTPRDIPQSCSEACVRPPGPHQTGLCTEAGRCHPAILNHRENGQLSVKRTNKYFYSASLAPCCTSPPISSYYWLILIIILSFGLRDSRVTQLKSSLFLASSSSEPRAWSASWSFFLWRGCLMPSSYNTHTMCIKH